MEAVKVKFDKFKRDLDKSQHLKKLQDLTHVPKEYIVIGSGVLVCFLLFFRICAGLICNLAGFVYPTYQSFKSIESESTDDDTQWLVYWVFYAAFTILDTFIDFLLQWIPFYYFFKLGFLIWSFHPSTQGAKIIYEMLFKNLITSEKIDGAFMAKNRKNADVPPPPPTDDSKTS